MIKKSSEILDELMNLQKNGLPPGFNVGHTELDKHIKFVKGGCTDITGYPFYGKSIVAKEFMVGLALNHNWKFLAYMADDGSDVEVLSNLMQKITGKTFIRGRQNSISEKEITKMYMNLTNTFKFVSGVNKMEPMEFWELGKELGVDATMIDSWNYMLHKGEPTDPKYLRTILSDRNVFMESNKMHSFTIIHPKNPDPKANKDGVISRPTVYSMMGGSEWNNNGRNIIVIHKNSKEHHQPYQVHIDKVKPKHYGEVGCATLWLDWEKQKFYTRESADGDVLTRKTYAYGENKEEIIKDPMSDIQFNVEDNEPF